MTRVGPEETEAALERVEAGAPEPEGTGVASPAPGAPVERSRAPVAPGVTNREPEGREPEGREAEGREGEGPEDREAAVAPVAPAVRAGPEVPAVAAEREARPSVCRARSAGANTTTRS